MTSSGSAAEMANNDALRWHDITADVVRAMIWVLGLNLVALALVEHAYIAVRLARIRAQKIIDRAEYEKDQRSSARLFQQAHELLVVEPEPVDQPDHRIKPADALAATKTVPISLTTPDTMRFLGTDNRYRLDSIIGAGGMGIVYHVVPTLRAAQKAVDAGVDGLVVEGGEGGGFKNPKPVSSLVLLPLIRSHFDVPIIAAGGICDGVSMAAAFALGAEGVQMGTRMVSALESPVHDGWKNAIVDAAETDTCFLRTPGGPALRALRTSTTEELEGGDGNAMASLGGGVKDVYFEGKLENGIALTETFGDEPATLLHGDFRLDNICFDDASGEVVLFDWQTMLAGPGASDLAYFISATLPGDADESQVDELIDVYHLELSQHGVDVSRDRLRGQYEVGMLTMLHRLLPTTYPDQMELDAGRGLPLLQAWISRIYNRLEHVDSERILEK